jgi:hypothetical protein
MEHDLGGFREAFAVWRTALDMAPEADRSAIFTNAANEVADFISHGLDRTVAADELTHIAEAFGLDTDQSQSTIAHAFEHVPTTNGHDPDPSAAKQLSFIQSSAEFVRDFVPPDYLINRVLQRRFVYAFTGKTGSGKTAVVLYIAACVAVSKNIGDLEITGGRVLYLAGENPDDVRMRWIAMSQQMDFDYNTIEVYFIPGRFRISEMREKIIDELNRIGDIVLVIIDTSAAYYEGKEVNSNTEQAEHARMMRTLVGLPGGPCVLINCHPIKNAAPDNLLPLGAGAFLNEVDGNLTCQINDRAVEVHWQGKIRGQDFVPLLFEIESVPHERLKDSKGYQIRTVVAKPLTEAAKEEKDKAADANLIALLRAISEDGKATIAELGMRCGGWPKTTAQRRLDTLRGNKYRFVSKEPGSGFALTEKGKKYLAKIDAATKQGDLLKDDQTGLIIVGDCSKHARCKLCNGDKDVKRIKDSAIANCPVETLHETCAVGYFAAKKAAALS